MRILRSRSFRASVSDSNYHFNVGFRRFVTSCRAVVLPRFGGPEVLELHPNVDVPDLKPHEVLVRTRAVSINPLDTRVSQMSFLSLIWFFCLISKVCLVAEETREIKFLIFISSFPFWPFPIPTITWATNFHICANQHFFFKKKKLL